MGKVFISYRRDDSESISGRISDKLAIEFGEDNIFFDTDLGGGVNWVKAITEAILESKVIVVVIGENWLRELKRRQKVADDAVRMEIETAITREVQLLPVLVSRAKMPGERELPASIRALHDINAIRVNHASFHGDIRELISAIRGGFDTFDQRALERSQTAKKPRIDATEKPSSSQPQVTRTKISDVLPRVEKLVPWSGDSLGLPVTPIGLAPLSRRRSIRQKRKHSEYLLPNRMLTGSDSAGLGLTMLILLLVSAVFLSLSA